MPLGVHMATSRGQEAQKKGDLPDFGELVMLKFAERAPKEVPGWPEMQIEKKPVAKDYRYKDTAFLEFKIQILGSGSINPGLNASTNVTMFNKNGKVIWRENFMFSTSSHHKEQSGKDLKYWEDDNYKNLKEEMFFAADYTVSEFIKKLKTEK